MEDNGLLSFYKTLPSIKGFLDVTQLGKIRGSEIKRGAVHNVINNQSFYLKNPIREQNGVVKYMYDAEILLSQIYAKAGLTSAIYLPISVENKKFLASNDISSPNVLPAVTHLYPLLGSEVGGKTYIRTLPFLSKTDKYAKRYDSGLIYGTETMKQQTIMRILDVASLNDDRHEMNFFYDIKKSPQGSQVDGSDSHYKSTISTSPTQVHFPNLAYCQSAQDAIFNLQSEQQIMDYYRSFKPDGVVSIDYGASGSSIYYINNQGLRGSSFMYSNDFGPQDLDATQFKQKMVESESLDELIDKKQLAETIGSLNPKEVAQDIKDTIDYDVNPTLIDALSQSYNDMAETLLL